MSGPHQGGVDGHEAAEFAEEDGSASGGLELLNGAEGVQGAGPDRRSEHKL